MFDVAYKVISCLIDKIAKLLLWTNEIFVSEIIITAATLNASVTYNIMSPPRRPVDKTQTRDWEYGWAFSYQCIDELLRRCTNRIFRYRCWEVKQSTARQRIERASLRYMLWSWVDEAAVWHMVDILCTLILIRCRSRCVYRALICIHYNAARNERPRAVKYLSLIYRIKSTA